MILHSTFGRDVGPCRQMITLCTRALGYVADLNILVTQGKAHLKKKVFDSKIINK